MITAAPPTLKEARSLLTGKPLNLRLGKKVAEGGEALLYQVANQPNVLAKLYKSSDSARTAKVRAMLKEPLRQGRGKPQVAWPIDGIIGPNVREARGILVPYAPGTLTLLDLFTPKLRQAKCPMADRSFIARVARNLAVAVQDVHRCGHLIVDINELNVLVRSDATVLIIDADSFQIRSGNHFFPCLVGRPEYTPPESARASGRCGYNLTHDNFGLAVLIYRLLMDGRHPFDAGDSLMMTTPERIQRGRFPHTLPPPPGIRVTSNGRLSRLPGALVRLFLKAFIEGHINPYARPGAAEWERALADTEDLLAHLQP